MSPTPKQLLSFVVATALSLSNAVGDENRNLTKSEHLALIRDWLPSHHDGLQLVFEYESGNEKHQEFDSKTLHDRIDRVGPTVVIVEARNARDEQPRFIGGYNPNKWKNWLGFYERDPGLFVFDLESGQKWERKPQKPRWIKRSPKRYGLSFGIGDLTISPDLKAGSASDNSFPSPSGANPNLLSQVGDFHIDSIKVYKVKYEEDYGPAADPTLVRDWKARSPASPPSNYHSVPDTALPLLEVGLALIALALFRYKFR